MADDYENMTVAELKELLKEQGLLSLERRQISSSASLVLLNKKMPLLKKRKLHPMLKKPMMTSSKTMMTGMMTRTVSTLRNKNQFSMKQRKKPLLFALPRRRRLHLSDEPNGSDTSGCLAQDGVLLMEWTTNNVAISSTEDHLFVLDTAR